MFKTDNSLHVFVGPHEDTSIAAATAGDIFIVDENNAIISDGAITAAAHPYLKIGQKDGDGNVRFTPLFKFANITSKVAQADVARSEQSSVIGWDGASGSIEAINSNRYTVRVNFKNNVSMFSEQSDLHFFEYVSDASATQLEIADRIQQAMCANEKFSGKRSGKNRASVSVELLSAAVVTEDVAASTGTAAFVNGSKSVTIGATPTFAVGDYISAAADDATARYKVVAIDGNVATLSVPFQGATTTPGDGVAKRIDAATMAAAAAGLKITGLEQEWKLGLIPDAGNQITFEVSLDGWGGTTPVANTAAAIGSGHPRAIADLEWFAQGSAGAPYRHGAVPSNADLITLYADGASATSYNMIELQVDLEDPGHAVAGSGKGKMTVVLAALAGASQSAVTTALVTTGDAWD
tara:strand:+ start:379 stop:1605 length:1227 start_codon:yes stop_codon:yes gene_type:complete